MHAWKYLVLNLVQFVGSKKNFVQLWIFRKAESRLCLTIYLKHQDVIPKLSFQIEEYQYFWAFFLLPVLPALVSFVCTRSFDIHIPHPGHYRFKETGFISLAFNYNAKLSKIPLRLIHNSKTAAGNIFGNPQGAAQNFHTRMDVPASGILRP